jgi:hypothetical protein
MLKEGTSKSTTGRVFSPNLAKPHLTFEAALRGEADELHQDATASTRESEPPKKKKKQVSQFWLPL